MPRPGPRPYECVRRAWHSESHQALRGGLTQEIFRIVTEIHSPEIRSKKEWQEKLPIVVLRAEEILYSKARTEVEYTDVSTLKSRLEDAVNTMIRRTDNVKEKEEETGAFMEPCVEAALSLGCVPKMNPRGQRPCSARLSGSYVRRPSSNPPLVAAQPKQSHESPPFLSREWTAPSQQLMQAPRFNGTGIASGFEQQQQQQRIHHHPSQHFNLQWREQSFAAPPPVFSEDIGYHPEATHPQCLSRVPPAMVDNSRRIDSPSHDLDLSLGPPKMKKHLEASGSSSSSGSSMSWQSEGRAQHQDCSKRKAVACTFTGGPQFEATKRQRDFPFY